MSQEKLPKRKQPEKALSAALVRNASEPGHYADGNCLYLVIDDAGSKKWVLRVTYHGKRHDLGLGSARLISLAEAREEALRLRRIARMGGDPLAQRRKERQVHIVPTFEGAARQVHQERAKTFRNEKHGEQSSAPDAKHGSGPLVEKVFKTAMRIQA